MKTLKMIIGLTCMLALVASLAACAGQNKPADTQETTTGTETQATDSEDTTEAAGNTTEAAVPESNGEVIVIELGDADGIEELGKQAQNFDISEGTSVEITGLFSSGISTPSIQEERDDGSSIGINMYIDGDFDAPADKTEISIKGTFVKGQYYMELHVMPEDIVVK